jgi:hypothetical protein
MLFLGLPHRLRVCFRRPSCPCVGYGRVRAASFRHGYVIRIYGRFRRIDLTPVSANTTVSSLSVVSASGMAGFALSPNKGVLRSESQGTTHVYVFVCFGVLDLPPNNGAMTSESMGAFDVCMCEFAYGCGFLCAWMYWCVCVLCVCVLVRPAP